MNERPNLLLVAAAAVCLVAAVALLFAADDLLRLATGTAPALDVAVLQLLGAALFGFAMLDWMNRYARIGGIYGRPLVVANFAHFATAALMLGHLATAGPLRPWIAGPLAVYAALAVGFAVAMVRDPATGSAG